MMATYTVICTGSSHGDYEVKCDGEPLCDGDGPTVIAALCQKLDDQEEAAQLREDVIREYEAEIVARRQEVIIAQQRIAEAEASTVQLAAEAVQVQPGTSAVVWLATDIDGDAVVYEDEPTLTEDGDFDGEVIKQFPPPGESRPYRMTLTPLEDIQ